MDSRSGSRQRGCSFHEEYEEEGNSGASSSRSSSNSTTTGERSPHQQPHVSSTSNSAGGKHRGHLDVDRRELSTPFFEFSDDFDDFDIDDITLKEGEGGGGRGRTAAVVVYDDDDSDEGNSIRKSSSNSSSNISRIDDNNGGSSCTTRGRSRSRSFHDEDDEEVAGLTLSPPKVVSNDSDNSSSSSHSHSHSHPIGNQKVPNRRHSAPFIPSTENSNPFAVHSSNNNSNSSSNSSSNNNNSLSSNSGSDYNNQLAQPRERSRSIERSGPLLTKEIVALKKGLEEAEIAARSSLEEVRTLKTFNIPESELEQERIDAEIERNERSLSFVSGSPRSFSFSGDKTISIVGSPSSPSDGRILSADNNLRRIKILVLGDSGVGKTSMIMRWSVDQFRSNLISTVGVNFKNKRTNIDGECINIQVWDTAGQADFHKITQSYYKSANGIIILYDITNRNSLDNVEYWIKSIKENAQENVHILLVGNKSDLRVNGEKNNISFEAGHNIASKFAVPFVETSAKDSKNVDQAIIFMARSILGLELNAMSHFNAKASWVKKENNGGGASTSNLLKLFKPDNNSNNSGKNSPAPISPPQLNKSSPSKSSSNNNNNNNNNDNNNNDNNTNDNNNNDNNKTIESSPTKTSSDEKNSNNANKKGDCIIS